MNLVTMFTADNEFAWHATRTIRELTQAYTLRDPVHVIAISDGGAANEAVVQNVERDFVDTPRVKIHRVPATTVVALAAPHARLLAMDYMKLLCGKIIGENKYVFFDADMSIVCPFPVPDIHALVPGALGAPQNAIHDPRNDVFWSGTQVDNGLLVVNDADAAYRACRTEERLILRANPGFHGSFTPGLVLQSKAVHDAGGLLPAWATTNWHDIRRFGTTAIIHHTGRSKAMRSRLTFGPWEHLDDGAGVRYSVTITPPKG